MRTVSRKWDWINAARKTIVMYERLRYLIDRREWESFLEENTTKRTCAYCKATIENNESGWQFTDCNYCVQFYIKNKDPQGRNEWSKCIRFRSYRNVEKEILRMNPNLDVIVERIAFHEEVIRFLMDVPDYATDAYIFEKIANLELE